MTGTTLSVPALTDAVMCMGIPTANSVLLVSFAREGLAEGLDAATAALEADLRAFAVLMTALAIGMIPMVFALGEGAEQNAPLGRAVIGGPTVATVATCVFRADGMQRTAGTREGALQGEALIGDRRVDRPHRA